MTLYRGVTGYVSQDATISEFRGTLASLYCSVLDSGKFTSSKLPEVVVNREQRYQPCVFKSLLRGFHFKTSHQRSHPTHRGNVN